MSHTNSWDETEPTNSTLATSIDDEIRKVRLDARERLAVDHKFAASDAGEDSYGNHKQITFDAPITSPTISSNETALYVQTGDVAGEIRYKDVRGVAALLSFVGEVRMRLGTTVPSGWLALNGDSLGDSSSGADKAGANYEELFTFLWNEVADSEAPVSGGRGASAAADWAAHKTLTMPDARARSPICAGTDGVLTSRTIGDTGGAETHTLTISEMPAHDHDASTMSTDGLHDHDLYQTSPGGTQCWALGVVNGDSCGWVDANCASDGSHTHTLSMESEGGGSAHNNMHPFIVLAMLIRY